MPQAFLGANPGTTVEDFLEPELYDAVATADVTVTWVQVNFPCDVAVVAELGTIVVGVTGLDIEVVGADDASATNLVSYGRFAPINGTDDADTERVLVAAVFKPFLGVTIDHTGTGNAPVKVVVRPKDFWQGNTRTA